MIFFLPIEPLASRYTEQMLKWVAGDLAAQVGEDGYEILLPEYESHIQQGQFLDNYASVRFKARQIEMVSHLFEREEVRSRDLFLLGDVWFPGVEAIRMMADLAGVGVKIAGWHYAGTFDPADYYSRALQAWARRFEEMVCEHVVNAICVGSSSHASVLARNLRVPIYAYGLSWKPHTLPRSQGEQRENIIVFPHRIAPEKNIDAFLRCARRFEDRDWRFIVSVPREQEPAAQAVCQRQPVEVLAHDGKESYYSLLRSAKIVYSAAYQETFGYAVNEAIACGCAVVAPNRLSYPEVLERNGDFLYDEEDHDGATLLAKRMADWKPVPFAYTDKYTDSTKRFLVRLLQ